MRNRKFSVVLTSTFLLVILAGCWDDVEVEDRAFISGVAVDLAGEQGGNTRFEMTNQLIVPAGIGTPSGGGGGGEKAFRNLSQTGESLYEINSAISKQANRKTNIEHIEIAIISKDLAKEKGLFADIMDVFIRQENMRRGILMAISDGKAKDFLDLETEHAKVPAQYVSELMENRQVAETTEPIRVGDIQEDLLMNRSYIIPQIAMYADNSINYEGLAVFQGHTSQLVDTLKGDEAKGLNLIIGENQQGSITADVEGDQATFLIKKGGSKLKLKNKSKENLEFQVDIEINASIAEYFGSLDFYKKENRDKFEKALEDKVKKLAEDASKKIKDDLQVDVLTFDKYLRMHHYKLWKEIEGDWDYGENYFAKSNIKINVKTTIQEPGNSIRMKKEGEDQ
ncbi:Ger(x)C family spore germination protein [Oceanobacillus sp. CF4.6]|uniref:Ger(x)C family spore germination protein n=1 Tax=Oceanobacillus sp. CF4.6 TaxID=3373080 RepID=UPI003EE46E8F